MSQQLKVPNKFKHFTIDTYQDTDSLKFYFKFEKDGETILESRPYDKKLGRERGVKQAVISAADENKYKVKKGGNGKHYFCLIRPDGALLANSMSFDTIPEMEDVISDLVGHEVRIISRTEDGKKIGFEEALRRQNTQRAIESYRSHEYLLVLMIEGYKNNQSGKYHFHYEDMEGIPIIVSKGYDTESDCDKGIKAVIDNASYLERYTNVVSPEDGHYFELRTSDGQLVEKSVSYGTEEALNEVKEWFCEVFAKTRREIEKEEFDRAEAIRLMEEKKRREEEAKIREEQDRIEQERIRRERVRKAEEKKAQEQEALRLEREKRQAEKQRRREELAKQKAEVERLAEEKRKQEELERQRLEAERLAEEKRKQEELERQRAEKQRLAEEKRKRIEEEKRLARERKKVEKERKKEEAIESKKAAAIATSDATPTTSKGNNKLVWQIVGVLVLIMILLFIWSAIK